MYVEEAEEIFDYWRESPPTYQLVSLIAQALGWKPEAPTIDGEPPEIEFEMSPSEAEAIGAAAGLPAPIVSLDEMRERNRQRMLEIALRNPKSQAG